MLQQMKIISLNINCLKTRIQQNHFNNFVREENPDILSLQETNTGDTHFMNENYDLIINENIENRNSGTILIYKKTLNILVNEKSTDGRK